MSKKRNSSDSTREETEDFKKRFGELPLNEKLTTLMQLEADTMSEAVTTIVDKSIAAGENVMEKITDRLRTSNDRGKSK